ncbi:peptide deformylase [Candidatus Woesebacteria bacterium CG_4_10_14_0_2_um_filter_39_14]|uniref:Peptide deformylase n=3 Tax=Microgenomates group TaxID=1794810 RepID=A0A2M6YPL1_9BACT|nr:MAG: peptide deformylase [Candidatus Shapirobacteria bacterium CG07_land_8_20_14_0_80_39_12]PIZ48333.1 MAG: peptide deformylase [Candidatus Woesebacteria bacterium CG_4_10_14_0_2_um_filter_39_14]
MIRKIITIPHPLLRQKSKPVRKIDKKIEKVIVDLLETVKNASEPEGLGLSAIQIAQTLRIFVAKTGKNFEVFINPKITFSSKKTLKEVLKKEQQFFEGCLSIPGIYGFVDRPYQIKMEWQDEKGKKKVKEFKNRLAICLQHELDHLNGILFIDRLLKQKGSPRGEAGKIYELKKNQKGEDLFEEVEL